MARILIAGCGYVGSALATLLVQEGHSVWGLNRQRENLPKGVEPLIADVTRPETLRDLPPAPDFVFYLVSADRIDSAAYKTAYVDGVNNLLHALGRRMIRRFFLVSSTRVYPQKNGEWVDETTKADPHHFAGRRLLEGEELALSAPWPGTVVRFGGIYGPGRTGLVERIREGKAVVRQGSPLYTNRIHRDDCVGILSHLMRHDKLEPLYLGVDCEPAEQALVYRWIAARLGVSPPPIGNPEPTAYESRGESNKRCSNKKILSTGYKFLYPTFREGYGALICNR